MSDNKIEPQKVTKPIQLLAAWLVGLVLVDSAFLTAAALFEPESIERLILTIAAIVNVPLFLGSIFLLQTKFRPELQEDSFYATYLDKKTQNITALKPIDQINTSLKILKQDFSNLPERREFGDSNLNSSDTVLTSTGSDLSSVSIAISNKLENSKAIRIELLKRMARDIDLFDPEISGGTPTENHLTINPDLPDAQIFDMIKMGIEFGFDRYGYDRPDGVNEEDVYFGGYGYLTGASYPLNEALASIISDNPTKFLLGEFEIKNESE